MPARTLPFILLFAAFSPAALAQSRPSLTCAWRAATQGGPDNPAGDAGFVLPDAGYLTDADWRAVDEHMQRYHFGLWTGEEVAAVERLSGVSLAVLTPLPDGTGPDGFLRPAGDAGVVQWPDRVSRGTVFLVAIGDAEPGEDWVLRAVGDVPESGAPPVDGAASATALPSASGFFRVHRVVGGDAYRGRRALYRAERVELNALGVESDLRLSAAEMKLAVSSASAAPQVVATGSYAVRSLDAGKLDAPAVVNLSLRGPGSDLFTLEVLPASGEPALASARDVRVQDSIVFRVLAPPAVLAPGGIIEQVLPPGQSLRLEVQAEIVSFANKDGGELDLGLSEDGFSVAPGTGVTFAPARQLPRDVVLRRAALEVWRDAAE